MFRAPARPLRRLAATAVCALWLQTALPAPAGPGLLAEDQPNPVAAGAFEIIRRFDFDERPLGNYEETPRDWVRLEGDGLPRYSVARLDDDFGRMAPPSFRFDLQGGNIAYEYVGQDLPLTPGAEHLVVAYARAVGLPRARAFMQIALLDEAGEPIPGSDRVSNLVGSTVSAGRDTADAAEPWQRLEVAVPTGITAAAALRLTLWVLQPYAWRVPSEVDPIMRQDVGAQIWFDDLTLYRLPHVGLRLSTSAAIVRYGMPASFLIEVHNPAPAALQFELSTLDACERRIHMMRGAVPRDVSPPLENPVPPLEPATYTARLQLCDGSEVFGSSVLRFAVVAELPAAPAYRADFGVDVGDLQPDDADGLVDLVRELRCGAVKLGLRLPDDGNPDTEVELARDLVRKLLSAGIDPAGVILAPQHGDPRPHETAQAALMTPQRSDLLAPLLFPLGNAITFWQIGDERTELAGGSAWTAAALQDLHRDVRRFAAVPQIVLPRSVFDAAGGSSADGRPVRGSAYTASVHVPANTPTRALPAQLADLDPAHADWLMLEVDSTLAVETRIAEIAQRLTLAKATGVERIFVPAPLGYDSQAARWYPTEEYIALRTLFHFLVGKRAAAVLPTGGQDALAILFADERDSACIVAWSWRDPPGPALSLCGGAQSELWDLSGRHEACGTGERILVPLSATPVIVSPVNSAAVALQASLTVDPNFMDADNPEARPILRLCNPFADEMAGTIRVTLPPYWRAPDSTRSFRLSGGETLEWPLTFSLPPRETSGEKLLEVALDVSAPVAAALTVTVPVRLGLSNVTFEATTWWQEDDLIVEQIVHNHGNTPLDFACSCQAAGRPQLDGALLAIVPGGTKTQVFQITNARDLAGTPLVVGLKKPDGRRVESVITVSP